MSKRKMTYGLLDGVSQNAAHPSTFEIPSEAEREALAPGDYAKLCFEQLVNGSERMWVIVGGRLTAGGSYVGLLSNQPIMLEGLNFGDRVVFEARNVISIETAAQAMARASTEP